MFRGSMRVESRDYENPEESSTGERGFPQTDYFFHYGFGQMAATFLLPMERDRSGPGLLQARARNTGLEAGAGRAKEMAVFALISDFRMAGASTWLSQ